MNSQAKTENEPYTPTTAAERAVADIYSRYGTKPVEQGRMFPLMVEAFLRGEAAARPRLVAESREALVHYFHEEGALEQAPERLTDSMIADGVVTLATPAETGERLAKIEALIAPQWRSIAYDRNALIDDIRAILEAPVASQGDTPAGEEMVYVGTPDGSGGYEIPARELDAILRSKNVPVDALGFPTEVGATFRARFAGNPEDYTPHHFRVSEPGRFWLYSVGNYRRYHLNPASIEDVRPADGRNGQ